MMGNSFVLKVAFWEERVGGSSRIGVEGAAGEAEVEGGVVDGFLDFVAREQAGGAVGIRGRFREEAIHVELVGEFVEE